MAVQTEPRPDLPSVDLPEPLGYRVKRVLLGPPLVSERLSEERLGKLTAMGVLSPDCISSTAYGTEEMLRILVPAVGMAAFTLVIPVTIAILVVLLFVTMSYLEVVQVYTKTGGSYAVTRDNYGPKVAQIAGVALIIDYTVTVAVQVAAGTAALTSAVPAVLPYTVPVSVAIVVLLCYGNLRGIREAGKMFALPTYLFIFGMVLLVVTGLVRGALGQLHPQPIDLPGMLKPGTPGNGLLLGASVYVMLKAFANGGSSLTGLEAVSNGVGAIKEPSGRNAKKVMLGMSLTLGSLVLGVSWLAHLTHATPYVVGSPTVVAQEAQDIFGHGPIGQAMFFFIQAVTMLILFTGANTSFNGFPFLASFVATDSFLPRQLTRRGHRLAFSNGILVLTVAACVLLIVTRAQVDSLVAVYAIGVFTGFTMAGLGMVKHHLVHHEPHWRRKTVINGSAALLSAAVVVIFSIVKFTQGAWAVLVLFPLLIALNLRLHRRYEQEEAELEEGAPAVRELAVPRRHVVVVLVEKLDLATARAIRYSRTLAPDEQRFVHFVIDEARARQLQADWERLGLSARFPLELVDCPDRRLARAALELVAEILVQGDGEVSVLIPRRAYSGPVSRVIHDRTADRISAVLGQLPHVNATIIPFQLGKRALDSADLVRRAEEQSRAKAAEIDDRRAAAGSSVTAPGASLHEPSSVAADGLPGDDALRAAQLSSGATPISEVRWRQRVRVAGRVRSVSVQEWAGVPSLECALADETGSLTLVFLGRRAVPGVEPGVVLSAEGRAVARGGRLVLLNPDYRLLTTKS
jgi:amino acid transporter